MNSESADFRRAAILNFNHVTIQFAIYYFLFGDPLELSLYFQPFSRYSAQQMLTNEQTNEHDGSQYLDLEKLTSNP